MNEKSSSNMSNNSAQVFVNGVVDPISVLHVDDEEIFLQATKIFLEKTTGGKIQVDSLINPEQVFGKLEKKKYDVIVADYIMPSMDGLQLLERLRNQNNDVPYILLTGRGREEIVIKALNLGANRYIKKGMDTESQFSELIHAIEEVVHHKRTYEALQESEKKFRSIIDNLSEIVVEADVEGVFSYVSPQVFDILGYKPEELIGKSGFDHVHPDDMERAIEIVENALKGKTIFNFEYRKKHKDGHYIWASSSGRFDKENRLVFVIKDITESRKLQKRVQQERQQFEKAINSLNHPFYVIDVNDYTIQLMNTATKKIFGEFTQPITCYKLTHNENKPCSGKDHQCPMIEVIKTKKSYTVEHHHFDNDGNVRTMELHCHPIFDQEGNMIQLIEYSLDITKRKNMEEALRESEERFRLLGENIAIGLSIVQEGKLIFGNDSFFEITGFPKEEILGIEIYEFNEKQVHPEDLAFVQEQLQKKISDEKDGLVPRYQYRWYSKNNQLKWIEVISKSITFQGKSALLGAIIDITRQKQAEKALRESEEKYRIIFELAPIAIGTSSFEGKQLTFNLKTMEMLGYAADEFDELRTIDLEETYVNPDDRKKIYKELTEFGKLKDWEVRRKRKDGSEFWALMNAQIIEQGGQNVIHVTMQDTTERKKAEEVMKTRLKLEQLMAHLSSGFVNLHPEEMDQMITNTLKNIAEFAGAVRSSLFLYSEDLQTVTNTHEWCKNPENSQIALLQNIPSNSFGYYWELFQQKKNVVMSFKTDLPPEAESEWEWIREYGWQSALFVPMVFEGKLYGTLGFYGEIGEEGQWSDDLVPFLLFVATILTNTFERKKAEKEMLEGEERLRSFMEAATDSILLFDSNLNFITLNKAAEEEIGLPREEILGKHYLEVLPHLKGTKRYEAYKEVIRTGKPFFIETLNIPRFGDKSFSIRAFKVGDGLGMIISDITERKRTDEALQESEDKYRNLFENFSRILNSMADGIYIVNAQHEIEFVNSVLKQEFGYPNGKKCYNYFHDRTESCPWCQNEKVFAGKTVRWEWTSFKNDKTYDLIDTPLKNPDGSVSKLEIFRDITERKQMEEALRESEIRYRKLFEESPVSLWEEDFSQVFSYLASLKELGIKDFREYFTEHPEYVSKCASLVKILDVNQATLDLYEAKSKDEIIENLNRVFVEESYDTFREELIALAEGADKFSIETTGQNLKGEKIHADLGLSISTGYGDPSSRVLISILDVTKRKQAEEALKAVNKELQDFASIVAHDLKAPLRNMKTIVDWFLRDFADDLNEEGKEYLSTIVKLTTHMNMLIDGVYQYSKIDRFQKEIVEINLKGLLSEIIDVLNPPDNIKINIQAELSILAVDRTHITQIFSNLIENAIKFMNKPKGHININCEEKKNLWQFSVADTGPGIEEENFERIFQMFQTLSPWDETKGTGIGLAIVKKIVEMNEGKIWVESSVGKGSTFFFTLPKGS